jgi:outer membrane protein OmpA-like peptidoglycan-associated protein
MKSLLFGTLFLVLFSQLCPAQNPPVDNSMSKVVMLSLGGGITLNRTDYKYQKYDYIGKGSLDYFFPSSGRGNFGLGVYGGIGKVDGKDARFIPVEFNTDIDYVGIEATYILSLSKVVYPYVSVGFSSLWFHPKDNAGNALIVSPNNNQQGAYNGEIGLRFMASNSLSLNVAGGLILCTNDYLDALKTGPHNDAAFTITAGLSLYFGRNRDSDHDGVPDYLDKCPGTPPGVKVDAFGCPLDSDGDGVPDYLDKCPNTPAGVAVDASGCPLDSDGDGVPDYLDKCPNTPAGVSVDASGCPLDSDGDGVPDYLDKCPNTPTGVQVDRNGCPLDSDGDGVPDYLDKCPNTPKGVQVDKYGCPIVKVETPKKLVLRGDANFATGKSDLLPASYAELNKVLASMKDNPTQKWLIEGYTDNVGSNKLNLKLSGKRAQSVVDYFVSHGIDKSLFITKAMGKADPVASNKTKEGRAENRRVEIKPVK